MTQVFKNVPTTPKAASRMRATLDGLIDPALFKILGEPTRAKLLSCLIKCGRPCSVTEVAECCALDFSMVARHLTALAREGVLDAEKQGRTMWYTARSESLVEHFRALAESIEQWHQSSACCDDDCCESSGDGKDGCCG